MANIHIECRGYNGRYAKLNGRRDRNISRYAFLRAVITVGAQRLPDVFSGGLRGITNRIGILLSLTSFLEQRANGFCLSDRYDDLDMSQKGYISYWYGMTFAKLVAESELSIPWLGNVDKMKASGALITSYTRNERADLVGRLHNDWHVIEAKGRSNEYSSRLVEKAKSQAAAVISINGQSPATSSACIASLFTQPISVLLDDPTGDSNQEPEQWKIKDDEFFREYYRGIIQYLHKYASSGEMKEVHSEFVTAKLFQQEFFELPYPPPPWAQDLELGLLKSIYSEPKKAPDVIKDLPSDDNKGAIGRDGIAIFGPMPDWEIA
jgi:hypothetical protein